MKKTKVKFDNGDEKIIIRGARTHNLKNVSVELPRGKMVALRGFLAPARALWRLILSLPRVSAVTSNPFLPMPVNFYAKCKSQMWMRFSVCHPRFLLIKKVDQTIHVQPWQLSLKSMTT
jgi:hypothetical protein